MNRRFVIVGGGVAGVSAANAIHSQDASSEVVIVHDDPDGFYSRPGLAYYLTDEIPEKQLFPFGKDAYKHLKIKWLQGAATRLEPQSQTLEIAGKGSISYDSLLLATGALAIKANLPGVNLDGVVKLDNLTDARRLTALVRKAKSAVVFGGGITALELVEALIAQKINVHYFLRGDRFWSNTLDEMESRIIENRLIAEGVTIHYRTEINAIQGKNGKVGSVVLNDGRALACEIVGMAIGIRPRLELALNAGLKTERGVLVNEYMETSASNVFAAGDVAQAFDPFTNQTSLDALWNPARERGHVAGLNMTGKRLTYSKPAPINVTRLAGLTTAIIGTVGQGNDRDMVGMSRGDSETWHRLPISITTQDDAYCDRLRILVLGNTIIGAMIMGNQIISKLLQQMISSRTDILPIREQILQPGAPVAKIVMDYWSQLENKAGHHAA